MLLTTPARWSSPHTLSVSSKILFVLFHLFLHFCLSLCVSAHPLSEPSFTRHYEHGPILLSFISSHADTAEKPYVQLYHSVDVVHNDVHVGIHISDASLLTLTTLPRGVWAGFGLAASPGGSSLEVGLDLATIEFSPSRNRTLRACTLVDRYVPWTAYPLVDAPIPFPHGDDCPSPDWTLVSCAYSAASGKVTFEVSRSLSIGDKMHPERGNQDRAIVPGVNNVVAMYGAGSVVGRYHWATRASGAVTFYEQRQRPGSSSSFPPPNGNAPELPSDVSGSFEITSKKYFIPAASTPSSACTSMRVPLQNSRLSSGLWIRAAVPIPPPSQHAEMATRLLVYLCDGAGYHDEFKEDTTACDVAAGPLARPDAQCSTLVYAWARGAGRLVLPPGVGFLASGPAKKRFIVLHATYANPNGRPDVADSSGVRLYYSYGDGSNLKHRNMMQAGSLILGDPLHAMDHSSVVKSNTLYTFTCPAACTRRFLQKQDGDSTSSPSSVNLAAVLPFMRSTGRAVTLSIYDNTNTFSRAVGPGVSVPDFWSSYRHHITHLPAGTTLKAGEQLALTCAYDTTKRLETTFGDDESCVAYAVYWPVRVDTATGHEFGLCAMERSDDVNGEQVSVCGEPGKLIDWHEHVGDFPKAKNPAFDDSYARSVIMKTGFGESQNVDTCGPYDETMDGDKTPGHGPDGGSREPGVGVGETNGTDDAVESFEPTAAPDQEDGAGNDDDGSVCFPAHATVTLESGLKKRMDEVVIGDSVLVSSPSSSSNNKPFYSSVFLFTHNDHTRVYSRFVTLTTAGNHSLTATAGHYIYVNGGMLMRMQDVRVGMTLTPKSSDDDEGKRMRVRSVKTKVRARGLFNPQTIQGDIVVDGVTATTFTQAIEAVAASALLAPVRALFRAMGSMVGNGKGNWVMKEMSRVLCGVSM